MNIFGILPFQNTTNLKLVLYCYVLCTYCTKSSKPFSYKHIDSYIHLRCDWLHVRCSVLVRCLRNCVDSSRLYSFWILAISGLVVHLVSVTTHSVCVNRCVHEWVSVYSTLGGLLRWLMPVTTNKSLFSKELSHMD
jgi:hypothetical protein